MKEWIAIGLIFALIAEMTFRVYVLRSQVARLESQLKWERESRERDITFIEDYFDRCDIRPKGPRVHCQTTWCTRPESHPGDCK